MRIWRLGFDVLAEYFGLRVGLGTLVCGLFD